MIVDNKDGTFGIKRPDVWGDSKAHDLLMYNKGYTDGLAQVFKWSEENDKLKDRIAELEKENDGLKGQLEDTIGYIEGVDSVIAYWKQKGKTQTNAEPVAWMQTWENSKGEKCNTFEFERIGINDIPLYTTPQTKADWNCDDLDMTNIDTDLEQFCADNIRLAPFFALLRNRLHQGTTPQTKLSDEEIEAFAMAFGLDMGMTYEFGHRRFNICIRAIEERILGK